MTKHLLAHYGIATPLVLLPRAFRRNRARAHADAGARGPGGWRSSPTRARRWSRTPATSWSRRPSRRGCRDADPRPPRRSSRRSSSRACRRTDSSSRAYLPAKAGAPPPGSAGGARPAFPARSWCSNRPIGCRKCSPTPPTCSGRAPPSSPASSPRMFETVRRGTLAERSRGEFAEEGPPKGRDRGPDRRGPPTRAAARRRRPGLDGALGRALATPTRSRDAAALRRGRDGAVQAGGLRAGACASEGEGVRVRLLSQVQQCFHLRAKRPRRVPEAPLPNEGGPYVAPRTCS